MKRIFLFSLLACCLCGFNSLAANETVRAAQTRLKQDGFYFGEITGSFDSETSAAVSRYQIRNGLGISGQLNAETAKALGIGPAADQASAPTISEAESWRRLRRSDQQFLKKYSAPRKNSSPRATPPTAVLVPAEAGDSSRFVLSRERLRDYVGAFVLAGLDPRVGAELEFFSDRVDYYGEGIVSRAKIRSDLKKYNERWPQRRFSLAGEVDVQPQPDSRLRVSFPLRFELRNGSRRSAGKIRKELLLEVLGEDLQIVAVNERKAR